MLYNKINSDHQENALNGDVEAFCRLLASKKSDSFKGMLKMARKCKAAFPESCELLCGKQINSKQAKTDEHDVWQKK